MIERISTRLFEDVSWGGVFIAALTVVVTLAGSLLLVAFLLVKLPATYFQDGYCRDIWVDRHPALRLAARAAKNALGVLLVALGMLLSLPGIPGQGVLTILIGMMLIDVPGKRRLERRIIGRPRVLRPVNRLRKRFGRPPLVLGKRRGAIWPGARRLT
jgi:hypothetical protein